MDPTNSIAGVLLGTLIWLTGVGGAALMARILILFFGASPAVAIGTDLWFAALTKTIGGAVHQRFVATDWQLVRRLAIGSIPAVIITLIWLSAGHKGQLKSVFLLQLFGSALLLVAILIIFKNRLNGRLKALKGIFGTRLRQRQMIATVGGGFAVGVQVTLTSVGTGALVAVLLAIVYPIRPNTKSTVGIDIVHAVPLSLLVAVGHSWLGNLNFMLLASLLIASVPGIVAGSVTARHVNDNWVRYALAAMLVVSAVKMIWS